MEIQELFIALLVLLTLGSLRFGIPLLLMWLGKAIHQRLHLQS